MRSSPLHLPTTQRPFFILIMRSKKHVKIQHALTRPHTRPQENRGVSGPQGSSTPAFVETSPGPSSSSQANGTQGGGGGSGGGAAGTQSANGKGKGKAPVPRKVPASFGKTKGSIWCVCSFCGKVVGHKERHKEWKGLTLLHRLRHCYFMEAYADIR